MYLEMCQYQKKNKNNHNIKFCNSTIKGQRDEIDINKFKFYLKFEHSELCDALYKSNNNINNKIIIENLLNEDYNKNDLIENKIIAKETFEKKIKRIYCI